jgi:glycosyltransferase involved in cell wall biosynthesis
MNAKTEFLQRARQLKPASVYIWFDFGILKIIKQKLLFIDSMKRASSLSQESKVVIPGCISKDSVNYSTMYSCPIWRFCGGIIIVSSSAVEQFYNYHVEQLEECYKNKCLTWEVNLWAAIEDKHPDLFVWYAGDHNDTILPDIPRNIIPDIPRNIPPSNTKLIFLTMIKNESKIIQRCLNSAAKICDAICVCDTGSTDTTVDVVSDYFKTIQIPGKLYSHPWKDFGHNRSLSFLAAVDFCNELGWNPDTTYAVLLDGDMELCAGPQFNKDSLTTPGYSILQISPGIEYYNTRIIKIGFPWKCSGVTHEYWDGYYTNSLPQEFAYINDIGDGGCKSDKFERDIRLLEEGLRDDPTNERYMFYLAQSYKDFGRIDDSIQMYTNRVDAGGWFEEVWYSMYTIMKLYAEKKNEPMMEMWGMRAYEYHKERIENILYLVKYYRDKRQYYKAWHYWCLGYGTKRSDDALFIEPEAYTTGFEKERLIIYTYIFPERKSESLDYAITYFNKHNDDWAYNLIKWFVTKLTLKVRTFEFQPIGDFIPTSTSFCKIDKGYIVNVRYVNYRIQPDGTYMMVENGHMNNTNAVRTENYECRMDSNFMIISPLQKMNIIENSLHATYIKGLEDVRLFSNGSEMRYIATTLEYSYNGKIRQHTGKYSVGSHQFEDNCSLRPPEETECEKNWIPYKNTKIIYKWHPFQIGSVSDSNKLVIESSQDTPLFFRHMRGSSTFVEEGGFMWGLTHCVIYEQPRKYYHMVIKINMIYK